VSTGFCKTFKIYRASEPKQQSHVLCSRKCIKREVKMGRGILLWLLGVPIPVIILLALIWH
jgi:hypothetical protein